MPHPRHRRPRTLPSHLRRTLIYATTIGAGGLALVPAIISGSASAITAPSPCLASFTASAAADAAAIRQVDLGPVGIPRKTATTALVGMSRSGLYAGSTPMTAARAGVVVPSDPPSYVYQIAPPTRQEPVVRLASAVTHGQMVIGSRKLWTSATLDNALICDATTGPKATATVELVDDSTFVGNGDPIVQIPRGTSTSTVTTLVSSEGRYASQATASATLGDINILGNVTVRVSGQPQLTVEASGRVDTSTISYNAPTLSAAFSSNPGQFKPITDRFDLLAPVDSVSAKLASLMESSQYSSILPTSTFGNILSALGATSEEIHAATESIKAKNSPSSSQAGVIPVIRISRGTLATRNVGLSVHALSSIIRIDVIIRSYSPQGGSTETQLAELALGGIEALAYAPSGGYARPGNAAPPTQTEPGNASRLTTKVLNEDSANNTISYRDDTPAVFPSPESSANPLTPVLTGLNVTDALAAASSQNPTRKAKDGGYGGGGVDGETATRKGSPIPHREHRIALIVIAGITLIVLGRLIGSRTRPRSS